MDILHPSAIIGTNAWGSAAYSVMVRGSYVNDDTIRDAMRTAEECDLKIYDLARDYGFGKAQKMIGRFGTENIYISAKYTPFSEYKPDCVRKSLEKELAEAANVILSEEEIRQLESAADKSQAKIMGPDLFRAFVKK